MAGLCIPDPRGDGARSATAVRSGRCAGFVGAEEGGEGFEGLADGVAVEIFGVLRADVAEVEVVAVGLGRRVVGQEAAWDGAEDDLRGRGSAGCGAADEVEIEGAVFAWAGEAFDLKPGERVADGETAEQGAGAGAARAGGGQVGAVRSRVRARGEQAGEGEREHEGRGEEPAVHGDGGCWGS
jgi:hypothetical protein